MKILIPSTIEKITTLQDKSIKLSILTQELTPSQMFEVFKLYGKYGWFAFAEESEELVDVKVPELPKREEDAKSPSERLRGVIYVLFEKMGKPGNNFEFFYLNTMNDICDLLKKKIEKYENK